MMKEIEIDGVVTVPSYVDEDTFWKLFIDFMEFNMFRFSGGINEILEDESNHCG